MNGLPEKRNDLFVTECICYPRSGHHALKDVLAAYFGERLNYCEMYRDLECMRIGENSCTNFQKNHDFGIDTPVLEDRKYLVQIRDPIDAIISRWHLDSRNGDLPVSDVAFEDKSNEWLSYFTAFCQRWVWYSIPNRLIVRYSDLLANPYHTVSHVIQFMQGFQNFDAPKLKQALSEYPILPQRPNTIPYCNQA